MKWIRVNKGYSGHSYELWYNEKKLVNLSFSTKTKIARVETDRDKRLFFIEKKGLLHSKTVIKNEYGIKLGQVSTENRHSTEGMIEMDGKKYRYAFDPKNESALMLYMQSEQKPFLNCNLSAIFSGAAAFVKSVHNTQYPYLLMALCWYLLKPDGTELRIQNHLS